MQNRFSEVLAPAGTREALTAAVRCSADAVYLGGKDLNARRNAGNFNFEELVEAVAYAHARGVKIYLTLNTLADDRELSTDARRAIVQACEAGVDALIVQDLGVASLARQLAPGMPLHASTQMSVHTSAGVRLLEEAGFRRVVLARELSFEEIAEIKKNTSVELEIFVHGALCMSVSGQCCMSAMLGSRSANRGLCAQPCRLPFAAENGTGYDLSLKDLSIIDRLPELEKLGIKSFKIEGRMKRPEYVAAAVTACRRSLEGAPDVQLGGALKAVFSRSGFTSGYYDGVLGRDMFGTRQKEDVTSAAQALKGLAALYAKERQCLPVDMLFTAVEGEVPSLSVSCNGSLAFSKGDVAVEGAITRPLTREAARAQLSKCGGTPFFVRSLELELDGNISLPLSTLNLLRREALNQLQDALSSKKTNKVSQKSVEYPVHNVDNLGVFAWFSSEEQVFDDLSCFSRIILPLGLKSYAYAVPAAVWLPRFMFGREKAVLKQLESAQKNGADAAFASTLDGVALAKSAGMRVFAAPGTNIFNTGALEEISRMGVCGAVLSFELTLEKAARLGGTIGRGVISYGRLPLMAVRNCPLKNGNDCGSCSSSRYLTDRMGIRFPVRCFGGCPQVFNSRPLWMGDRRRELGFADFEMMYFTTESREECAKITAAHLNGDKPSGEFTRGLYYRGVE